MTSFILILFKISLVPIYVFFWYLVSFREQDPTPILIASVSISAALCALSFTGYSTFKEQNSTNINLYKLAAMNFLKATILAIVAIICSFFIGEVLKHLTGNLSLDVVKILYNNVLGFSYGYGVICFQFGLLQLFEVSEKPL